MVWVTVFISNKIRTFLTYLILAVCLVACKKDNALDCFKSNGADVTEIRSLSGFDKIELNDKIALTISKGSAFAVRVKAGKHIIKNIKTRVSDGVLIIENVNTCNFVRGYKRQIEVQVSLPQLTALMHNSVSDVKFDESFEQDSIYLNLESSGAVYLCGRFNCISSFSNGNGDLYLKGTTKRLVAQTQGTNYVHAEELTISESAQVDLASLGDVRLNGKGLKKLQYRIYKSGNLYYSGDVQLVSGSLEKGATGRLIHYH